MVAHKLLTKASEVHRTHNWKTWSKPKPISFQEAHDEFRGVREKVEPFKPREHDKDLCKAVRGFWTKKDLLQPLASSFSFKVRVYGLTVGRLAEPGESIFIFDDDEELPCPLSDDDERDSANQTSRTSSTSLG